MAVRTLAASLATTLVLGAGIVGGVAVAQADTGPAPAPAPTSAPAGPAAASVTVCLTVPGRDPFRWNRIVAHSWDRGVYRLRSVTQTASVPGGCGTVAVGSTGQVRLRAVHLHQRHVSKRLCVRTVWRAGWPITDASSIVDGSTITAQLRLARRSLERC